MYSSFNWHRHQAQTDSNSTQSICIIYSTYMSCIYRMEWKDGHRFYLRYPMLARTMFYDLRCWIFHLEVVFVYCFCSCCCYCCCIYKSIKFNLILKHFYSFYLWMHVNVIEMVCVWLMDLIIYFEHFAKCLHSTQYKHKTMVLFAYFWFFFIAFLCSNTILQ